MLSELFRFYKIKNVKLVNQGSCLKHYYNTFRDENRIEMSKTCKDHLLVKCFIQIDKNSTKVQTFLDTTRLSKNNTFIKRPLNINNR